jgi:hypothetical protein
MKIEWWYDDSFLKPETLGLRDQELFLARLSVNEDGSAQIMFPDGHKRYFGSEDEALIWFGDEEYRCLSSLIQDLAEEGRSGDLPIPLPSGNTESEILQGMRIRIPVKN